MSDIQKTRKQDLLTGFKPSCREQLARSPIRHKLIGVSDGPLVGCKEVKFDGTRMGAKRETA
jgi:hypothetical protein